MFEFAITDDFRKSLEQLDKRMQESIRSKLGFLSELKNPLRFAKRLTSYKDIFRFRAGDYRMVFRLEKRKIVLLLVKHRKDVYKGL